MTPAVSPAAPRIAKIIISDFRAFPNSAVPAEVDLGTNGANFLLFGENGAGKSSLFHALKLLLSERAPDKPFADHRNIFTAGNDGAVTVTMTAGMPPAHSWSYASGHPADTGGAPFRDLARRAVFLDYKALMKVGHEHEDSECVNLFELVIDALVKDAELPDGQTVGRHWQDLLHFVPRTPPPPAPGVEPEEFDSPVIQIKTEAKGFIGQLTGILNAKGVGIVPVANAILRRLCPDVKITVKIPALKVARISDDPRNEPHEFKTPCIRLEATYCGKRIQHPAIFLNEGRLSAIALALYLAAAKATTPMSAGSFVPRLLVMDDALIGLDMEHRLPLLEVLNIHFNDWQVLLMTFDRVWFELAQLAPKSGRLWQPYEMHAKPVQEGVQVFGAPVVIKPCVKPSDLDALSTACLARAKSSMRTDDRTAAFWVRVAFEAKLKTFCHRNKVVVRYDLVGRTLDTQDFLEGVERYIKANHTYALSCFAIERIKLYRAGVLNAYAHFYPVTIAPGEVELAVHAVEHLVLHNDKVKFAKEAGRLLDRPTLTPEETVDAACWLRSLFEADLREFLKNKGGYLPYRHNWDDLALGELWESAKERMNGMNGALATPLIADIETHRRVFLDEWKYADVSLLVKSDLDSAWNALRDPASPPRAAKTRLETFA